MERAGGTVLTEPFAAIGLVSTYFARLARRAVERVRPQPWKAGEAEQPPGLALIIPWKAGEAFVCPLRVSIGASETVNTRGVAFIVCKEGFALSWRAGRTLARAAAGKQAGVANKTICCAEMGVQDETRIVEVLEGWTGLALGLARVGVVLVPAGAAKRAR